MKTTVIFGLIISAVFLASCNKSDDNANITHINCDGLITDTLGTNDNAKIYMPSAFTPNGDGKNDISRPLVQNVSAIAFTIYDASNNVVFTSTTIGAGWSTTVAANTWTTYYYKIQVTTATGHHIGKCGELYKLSCRPSSIPGSSLYFEDQLTSFGFTGPTTDLPGNCP